MWLKSGERSSDIQGVMFASEDLTSDRAALAEVIQLSVHERTRPEPGTVPVGVAAHTTPRANTAGRDAEMLQRRCGDRWIELPADLGRTALGLEGLLERGPTALDSHRASPDTVVVEAWLVVRAAVAHAGMLLEEAEVLGEALGTPLADLDLRRLDQVAGAVIDLGLVRCGEPSWADPSEADVARLMLDANGAELRVATQLHRDVYERFTEQVWQVPEPLLKAGRRPWRLRSRFQLRRELTTASRTVRMAGSLNAMGDLLVRAQATRHRLGELAPLLDRHLGRFDQGPLTDVDAVDASLDAIRRLQETLGDRLDVERLHGLLLADAFTSPELATPAMALHAALRAWAADVVRLCGGQPWALPVAALPGWADQTGAALPALTVALGAMEELGRTPSSLRELVDDLLLREHAEDGWRAQQQGPAGPDVRAGNGSAS